MSQKQQNRSPWRRVPLIVSVLAIPLVGALLVTTITLLMLSSAGAVQLSWSSGWAIAFSILLSAAVFFVVFVLGAIYSLRIISRLMGEVLGDVFEAFSTPGKGAAPRQASRANPLDALLLSIARSVLPTGASRPRQGAAAATKDVVVDAAPPSSPEQASAAEPSGDAGTPPTA